MALKLDPARALIFRITHINNLPWILDHGLHCQNSDTRDPNFTSIGNPDLIEKRNPHPVPISPRGTLSDYIAFYFTPCSIMLYKIITGHEGTRQVPREEIVVLVSSLHRLAELGVSFVFTDRHAYLANALFSSDLGELGRINWEILQTRDFKTDPNNPAKKECYQAEALVHRHLPVDGLLGIGCYSEGVRSGLAKALASRDIELKSLVRREWYFG